MEWPDREYFWVIKFVCFPLLVVEARPQEFVQVSIRLSINEVSSTNSVVIYNHNHTIFQKYSLSQCRFTHASSAQIPSTASIQQSICPTLMSRPELHHFGHPDRFIFKKPELKLVSPDEGSFYTRKALHSQVTAPLGLYKSYSHFLGDIFAPKPTLETLNASRCVQKPGSLDDFVNSCKYQISESKPLPRNNSIALIKSIDSPSIKKDFYSNLMDWSSARLLGLADGRFVSVIRPSDEQDRWKILARSQDKISAIKFGTHNNLLAIGTKYSSCLIWDLSRGRQIKKIDDHVGKINSIDWFDNLLAIGSREGTLSIRDTRERTNQKVYFYKPHLLDICGLKWNHSGTKIASGGSDKIVTIFCMRTRKQFKFESHVAGVRALAWCPAKPSLLVSGGGSRDKYIRFFNTSTFREQASLYGGSTICSLFFSPDSNKLASLQGNFHQIHLLKTDSLWSSKDSITKEAVSSDFRYEPMYSALSPSGKVVATHGGKRVQLWRVFEAGKQQFEEETGIDHLRV